MNPALFRTVLTGGYLQSFDRLKRGVSEVDIGLILSIIRLVQKF